MRLPYWESLKQRLKYKIYSDSSMIMYVSCERNK
nr:MAG TPA: hypothetical protein [Caudoviricetes sp.]